MCTLTGHSRFVHTVAFSGDGAQVVSGSYDGTVRWWDVASGRQVRQLEGNDFALVEGLSGEHKRDRHIITASGDTLRIFEVGDEQQHAGDGAAAAPVAVVVLWGFVLNPHRGSPYPKLLWCHTR